MAGRGNPTGVFDFRNTQCVLNDYGPSVIGERIAIDRSADQMASSSASDVDEMVRLSSVGWQLRSYHLHTGDAQWLTAAQPGILSPGAGHGTMAPNHVEYNAFAAPLIPGVTYALGVITGSGYPMITARVPADVTDWGGNTLTPDQKAFPSPNITEDPVSMDRVFVSTDGAVNPGDDLAFSLLVPASALLSRGSVANLYFNGPAGCDADAVDDGSLIAAKVGTGQYVIKVRGDGRAYLYELLGDGSTWKKRFSFMWNFNDQPIRAELIIIRVCFSMWQDDAGNYYGDKITFMQGNEGVTAGGAGAVLGPLVGLAEMAIRFHNGQVPVYNVPRLLNCPVVVGPVRIDIARGCRASFNVARFVYKPAGSVTDDWISLGLPLTPDTDLSVFVAGSLPAGCTWTCTVVDQDNTLLAVSGPDVSTSGSEGQTIQRTFTPTKGMRYAQVHFEVTSPSPYFTTPTIKSYQIARGPVYQMESPVALVTIPHRGTPPAFQTTTIASIDITPQEADAGAENATIIIEDLDGSLDFLETHQMIPITLQTTLDVSGDYVRYFMGYINEAHGVRRRTNPERDYPGVLSTTWTLYCVGKWARFAEALVETRKQWKDERTNEPYKVTDVIRSQWHNVYPPSMVDVPDLDIQLLSGDSKDYMSEPGMRIAEQTAELATDYLGAYAVWDESAGDDGMIRLLQQKTPPYNNLAIFEVDHPTVIAGDGIPRLPHWAKSYPTSTSGDQNIVHTFIKAGTLQPHIEKAEGNCVICYGTATGDAPAEIGAQSAGLITQVAIQVGSFNFLGLDPIDPGYPDGSDPSYYGRIVPIKVFDWKLGSPDAVNWKTRRVYERTCFPRYFLAFDAPMIMVTDTQDDLQLTPRRLRFYDAVQVRENDGTLSQFLVVHCGPSFKKDREGMAHYLLVSQANINTIGVIPTQSSLLQTFLKANGRIMGMPIQHAPPGWSSTKEGQNLASRIMALPEPTIPPIQNWDNTSPDFGKFYWMSDYSVPDGGDIMR